MTGALLICVASGSGFGTAVQTVQAEEEQRITLNIADRETESETAEAADTEKQQEEQKAVTLQLADAEETEKAEETETESTSDAAEETETEAPETEEVQKETFSQIEAVNNDGLSIVTTDVSDIVENCMPSIVSITETSVEEVETYYYGTQEYEAQGAASGIIIAQNEEELLIATNSHVVDGAVEITVGFTVDAEDPEDLIVPAKLKGTDKSYELAVVAVQLADIPEEVRAQLKVATLGSSDKLKVGQAAIAIGNALGYGQSVTSGIVSALNREITIDNFKNEVILTDAAINFGNSGGVLLNSKGEVIGINVAKEAGTGTDSMGYSIPIDTAIPVLQKLINKETRDQMSDAERGYMGATVVNVSDDAKELYNMPQGAFVYEVSEGSAAEAAGIKKGDVITAFDGETVTSSSDLIEKMSYYKADETVTVEVQTANNGTYEAREVEVTLQPASADVIAEAEAEAKKQERNSQKEQNNSDEDDFDEGWNEEFDEGWNDEFGSDFY